MATWVFDRPAGSFTGQADTNLATVNVALADSPVELEDGSVTAVAIATEASAVDISPGGGNDDYGLSVRIISGGVVLAGLTSTTYEPVTTLQVSSNYPLAFTAITSFGYVLTTATKAQWDAATIEYQQLWSKTQASDNDFVTIAAGSSDITVTYTPNTNHTRDALLGTLLLAEKTPTVLVSLSSEPTLETLVLDGKVPTILVSLSVAPGVGSLALTGKVPTVLVSLSVAPALETVLLTGKIPTTALTAHHIRAPPVGGLTLTGITPTVITTLSVDPTLETLLLTGKVPTISVGQAVAPAAGSLALTGKVPTVLTSLSAEPAVGSLVLTGKVPTVSNAKVVILVGQSITVAQNTTLTGYEQKSLAVTLLSGPVEAPGVGSLTLTGKVPTIVVNTIITPAVGTLALTGKVPTVLTSLSAAPTVGSLVLTGKVPTIEVSGSGSSEAPDVGSLVLTGKVPTVLVSLSAAPAVGSLVLTGKVPTVLTSLSAAPATGSLVLTGKVPTVITTLSAEPAVGSLVLTGKVPTIVVDTIITPAVGSLTLTGKVPTVLVSLSASPAVGSLTLTGKVPTVLTSLSVAPAAGSLVLTGKVPTVLTLLAVDPGVGSLTLTGKVPTVLTSLSAAPAVGSLTLTGKVPAVVAGTVITPAVGSLTLTGKVPTVLVSLSAAPAVGSLTLTGKVPTVITSLSFDPGVGSLTLTGKVPTSVTPLTVYPAAGSLVLTGKVPTVLTTVTGAVDPLVGSLVLTGKVPTVLTSLSASPAAGALTLTGSVPTLVSIDPAAGSLTLTGYAPTVVVDDAVTPGVGSLTLTGSVPIVASSATPATGSLILTGYAPTVDLGWVEVGGAQLPGWDCDSVDGSQSPGWDCVTIDGAQTPGWDCTEVVYPPVALFEFPATSSLTLTGYAPTVLLSLSVDFTTAGSLALTGYAPSTARLDEEILAGSLLLTGQAVSLIPPVCIIYECDALQNAIIATNPLIYYIWEGADTASVPTTWVNLGTTTINGTILGTTGRYTAPSIPYIDNCDNTLFPFRINSNAGATGQETNLNDQLWVDGQAVGENCTYGCLLNVVGNRVSWQSGFTSRLLFSSQALLSGGGPYEWASYSVRVYPDLGIVQLKMMTFQPFGSVVFFYPQVAIDPDLLFDISGDAKNVTFACHVRRHRAAQTVDIKVWVDGAVAASSYGILNPEASYGHIFQNNDGTKATLGSRLEICSDGPSSDNGGGIVQFSHQWVAAGEVSDALIQSIADAHDQNYATYTDPDPSCVPGIGRDNLILTGYVPTTLTTLFDPSAAVLTLAGSTPTVAVDDPLELLAGSLVLTGQAVSLIPPVCIIYECNALEAAILAAAPDSYYPMTNGWDALSIDNVPPYQMVGGDVIYDTIGDRDLVATGADGGTWDALWPSIIDSCSGTAVHVNNAQGLYVTAAAGSLTFPTGGTFIVVQENDGSPAQPSNGTIGPQWINGPVVFLAGGPDGGTVRVDTLLPSPQGSVITEIDLPFDGSELAIVRWTENGGASPFSVTTKVWTENGLAIDVTQNGETQQTAILYTWCTFIEDAKQNLAFWDRPISDAEVQSLIDAFGQNASTYTDPDPSCVPGIGRDNLILTGYVPTTLTTLFDPSAAVLTLAGSTPTVAVDDPLELLAGSLLLTGQAVSLIPPVCIIYECDALDAVIRNLSPESYYPMTNGAAGITDTGGATSTLLDNIGSRDLPWNVGAVDAVIVDAGDIYDNCSGTSYDGHVTGWVKRYAINTNTENVRSGSVVMVSAKNSAGIGDKGGLYDIAPWNGALMSLHDGGSGLRYIFQNLVTEQETPTIDVVVTPTVFSNNVGASSGTQFLILTWEDTGNSTRVLLYDYDGTVLHDGTQPGVLTGKDGFDPPADNNHDFGVQITQGYGAGIAKYNRALTVAEVQTLSDAWAQNTIGYTDPDPSCVPGIGRDNLILTGYVPTTLTTLFDPSAAVLTLAGSTPTVAVDDSATPAAGSLALTGKVPTHNVIQTFSSTAYFDAINALQVAHGSFLAMWILDDGSPTSFNPGSDGRSFHDYGFQPIGSVFTGITSDVLLNQEGFLSDGRGSFNPNGESVYYITGSLDTALGDNTVWTFSVIRSLNASAFTAITFLYNGFTEVWLSVYPNEIRFLTLDTGGTETLSIVDGEVITVVMDFGSPTQDIRVSVWVDGALQGDVLGLTGFYEPGPGSFRLAIQQTGAGAFYRAQYCWLLEGEATIPEIATLYSAYLNNIAAELALTGSIPIAVLSRSPAVSSLALTGSTPTVAVDDPLELLAGSLLLTGKVPTVVVT